MPLTPFYRRMRKVGDRLIRKYGQMVTLHRRVQGTYSPSTGVNTVTTQDFTFPAVLLQYDERLIDEKLIFAGDVRCLMSAIPAASPQVGDTIIDSNGVKYGVVKTRPTQPSGVAIIYECQLRR